jgi:hypothetical protein
MKIKETKKVASMFTHHSTPVVNEGGFQVASTPRRNVTLSHAPNWSPRIANMEAKRTDNQISLHSGFAVVRLSITCLAETRKVLLAFLLT